VKINVLGKSYNIEETTKTLSGGDLMGAANRTEQVIVVCKDGIGPDQYSETLLHEVVHIVDEELKVGLTEEAVCRLAVGLYSAGCRVKVEQ
jgi:hypothetical protein